MQPSESEKGALFVCVIRLVSVVFRFKTMGRGWSLRKTTHRSQRRLAAVVPPREDKPRVILAVAFVGRVYGAIALCNLRSPKGHLVLALISRYFHLGHRLMMRSCNAWRTDVVGRSLSS